MTELPTPRPVGEVLAMSDDTTFAIELSNLVFYREAAIGFAKLSDGEKTAFLVDQLEREVNNGGFSQFFLNSSGDHARETPEALRAIGASQMAAIVEEALVPFGSTGPSPHQEARGDQLDELGEEAEAVWSECDSKFYEYPENLAVLLRAYCCRPAARLRTSDSTRPALVHRMKRSAVLPNMRLKLSARWRRFGRNAPWRPSFWPAAPADRSLSASR